MSQHYVARAIMARAIHYQKHCCYLICDVNAYPTIVNILLQSAAVSPNFPFFWLVLMLLQVNALSSHFME